MKFRNATMEDLPKIVDIYNSIIPGRLVTADTEEVSVESRKEWFLSHTATRPLLVSENNNELIGFLSFKSFYGRPAYSITSEIAIYLSEQNRGKGYGKAFLEHAIKIAPELKIENLLGFIFNTNTASISLFESFGFEVWGELNQVAKIDDKYYDLLIMGLKIKYN